MHWMLVLSIALVSCSSRGAGGSSPATPAPANTVVDACAAARRAERVDAVGALELHSAFWLNLHHVLYAEAWARRGPEVRSPAGRLPAALALAELADDERVAWDRAVAYYDRAIAAMDLL